MKKLAFVIATICAIPLSGCVGNFQAGSDFNMACVDSFKAGETTKDDALRCLGKPYLVKQSAQKSGREMLIWIYHQNVGVMGTSVKHVEKNLGLIFQDGILETVSVREETPD